jgi:hypothetical protein
MDENMGDFQCIPELYCTYDTWKLTQPEDRNRFKPEVTGLEAHIERVKLEAGDLLIFQKQCMETTWVGTLVTSTIFTSDIANIEEQI